MEIAGAFEVRNEVRDRIHGSPGAGHAEDRIVLVEVSEPHVIGAVNRSRESVERNDGADLIFLEPFDDLDAVFDFFRETYPAEVISKVMISGGTSRMPGLAEKIEEAFGYPTEILNPFRSIELGPEVDSTKAASLGPSLAVAVGLALRGVD